MPHRALGIGRIVFVTAAAALLVTCTDTGTSPRIGGRPSFAISDGASGGNVDVFFLPPLSSTPSGSDYGDRPANPNLKPEAKVCTLNATESNPSPAGGLACVTTPDDVADLPMTYNATGAFYQVNWKTSDTPLDTDTMYRVAIYVGRVPLAFRDVDPDPGPPTASCTSSDAFCQFNNGSNLPIKVRIETDAVCLALDPAFDTSQPCATASLDAGGSLSLSDLGIASVDQATTLSMQPCGDFRARGLVDLRTFGDCVQIEDVDYVPGMTLGVTGTATLCHAFNDALGAGLTEEQAERMTVHRFSSGKVPDSLVALPHSDAGDCSTLTTTVGQAPRPGRLDRLYRLAGRTWRATADRVRSWIEATPLWASPPMFCHSSGCGSVTVFESDYQVIQPAWMTYDASNPDGTFPAQEIGTTVTGKIKVLDSGEFSSGQSPAPAPVADVRLTVSSDNGTLAAGTPCADPDAPTGAVSICTGSDGIASFRLTLGAGSNTVTVRGVGVGTDDGDGDPVNNVFAPSMSQQTPVTLGVGQLTFTTTGLVTLVFVPDPPTGGNTIYTDANGIATFPDFQLCADPRAAGAPITSLEAVTNNGAYKTLGSLPAMSWVTGTAGCFTFSGVTINGTGAFHLLANDQYTSRKFNVKPGK